MKLVLAMAGLFCFSGLLSAGEIKFTGAQWDSLAIPLGINAFYLTVDSPSKVKAVTIEMDLYIKGKFIRTLHSTGLLATDRTFPVNLKSAIYFDPKNDGSFKGTLVMNCSDCEGTAPFTLKQSEFPIKDGHAASAVGEKLIAPGRTPVFVIIAGGKGGFTSAGKAEDTPKSNLDSSVIIGYLKTE